MKKILLNFGMIKSQEQAQEYLAFELDFPEYYGKNLEALYDCLTDVCEDTCIGVFGTEKEEEEGLQHYLRKIMKVLRDAEEENTHLCVIFQELEENYKKNEGLLL